MYVSYDFYKQTFGDTIPEADFSKVEAKAEAVIRYREEQGPFRTTEEIMKIPGIKEAAFQKIKDDITV